MFFEGLCEFFLMSIWCWFVDEVFELNWFYYIVCNYYFMVVLVV